MQQLVPVLLLLLLMMMMLLLLMLPRLQQPVKREGGPAGLARHRSRRRLLLLLFADRPHHGRGHLAKPEAYARRAARPAERSRAALIVRRSPPTPPVLSATRPAAPTFFASFPHDLLTSSVRARA